MLDTSCHTSGCAISMRVVALQAGYYVAQPPPSVRWRMGATIPEWRGSETRVRHRLPQPAELFGSASRLTGTTSPRHPPGALSCPDPAARGRAGIASTARQAGDGRPSLTKSICPCAAGRFVYMPQPPQTRRGRRVQDPMRYQFITARSGMLWRAHAAVLYAPVAEQADAPASKAASRCRFDSCLAHQYADTARLARVHSGHGRL